MSIVIGTVTLTHEITDEFIGDVLTGAFEGGSNYWIDHIETVTESTPAGRWFSEDVQNGGEIKVFPQEGDDPVTLNQQKFVQGFQKYLDWCVDKGRAFRTDPSDIDGDEADLITQFACFGEIVYG